MERQGWGWGEAGWGPRKGPVEGRLRAGHRAPWHTQHQLCIPLGSGAVPELALVAPRQAMNPRGRSLTRAQGSQLGAEPRAAGLRTFPLSFAIPPDSSIRASSLGLPAMGSQQVKWLGDTAAALCQTNLSQLCSLGPGCPRVGWSICTPSGIPHRGAPSWPHQCPSLVKP